MLEIILLAFILLVQAVTVWAIFELKWSFEAWADIWGRNALPASDHHAKEILKTLQGIAHHSAVRHLREQADEAAKNPSTYI